MKKFIILILLTGLTLAACGSPAASTAAATSAATEASVSSPATVAATEPPTATPEPTQPNAAGKVTVNVTEGDNFIKSDLATFKVGVPYIFSITNTGRRAHIFSIAPPVTDISPAGMDAAKAASLVFVSDKQLYPGVTLTAEYTFTQAYPAGTLEFACLILMHYRMGQLLPIVVEP